MERAGSIVTPRSFQKITEMTWQELIKESRRSLVTHVSSLSQHAVARYKSLLIASNQIPVPKTWRLILQSDINSVEDLSLLRCGLGLLSTFVYNFSTNVLHLFNITHSARSPIPAKSAVQSNTSWLHTASKLVLDLPTPEGWKAEIT